MRKLATVAVLLAFIATTAFPQNVRQVALAGMSSSGPALFEVDSGGHLLTTGFGLTLASGSSAVMQVVAMGVDSTGAYHPISINSDGSLNVGGGGGAGTVTSVAVTVPTWLAASAAITTAGTIAVTPASGQTSHQVIGTCGSATTFGPCLLVAADLPSTTVTPGSYTNINATVDQQGRITTASSGSSGGASSPIEVVYTAPGSLTFNHGLNSLFYQSHCVARVGSAYAPATYSDYPVDANNAMVTVPAAGDYICSFSAVAALPVDFNFFVASQTFFPTMTGTQHPTFAVNQTGMGTYSGTAAYTASGLASGMTGVFSPTSLTGTATSTLTLSFPAAQAAATTAFTVQGADGTKTHTATPSITVSNINQGLVDCWGMTDGSGTTFADNCGASDTQTVTSGSLTWGVNAGFPGTTPNFGVSTYTTGANTTATSFDGTGPFSFSTWATLSNGGTLASNLNTGASFRGWEIGLTGSAPFTGFQIYLVSTFGSNYIQVASSATAVASGAQHFFTMTYDGTKTAAGVKAYVDGLLIPLSVTSDTLTATMASTLPLSFGARPGSFNNPINGGVMAYTRIYNRALSASDITSYYNAGPR